MSTKAEMTTAINEAHQRAQAWFNAIPATNFFHREGDAWSASDNVDHLIRSVKPVAKAMGLPRLALETMFGRPATPSRPYDEICSIYRDAIAKGGQASGSYLPDALVPENMEQAKAELLNQLSEAVQKLLAKLETWEEDALEKIQLPHPLLGKLTVREMLHFTTYHILRHASQDGD
jgi:DinB superfamily